jgi:tRNA A-37 threonylcarbamoyl transferase component Bud32
MVPPDGPPPATLGAFRLIELIGRGGMGEVYRAEREDARGKNKRAAIKRILPRFQTDPALLGRFMDEARINARLEHPNIVQVIEFGVQPEPFLALEYVEGTTVARVLKQCADTGQRIPPQAAAFIVAEAATGLDFAHRKKDENNQPLNIVHRDVSPQNLLISVDGSVKVSDFGIARAADNQLRTAAGIAVGKLSYMSPEQASGQPIDRRADVFALGIVLWEVLLVQPLIPRNDTNAAIQILLSGRFDAPSKRDPKLPPAIDRIVLDALAVNPAQRTQSAGLFAQQLRGFAHSVAPGFDRSELVRTLARIMPDIPWVDPGAGRTPVIAANPQPATAPLPSAAFPAAAGPMPGGFPTAGGPMSGGFPAAGGLPLGAAPNGLAPMSGAYPGAAMTPMSGGFPGAAPNPPAPAIMPVEPVAPVVGLGIGRIPTTPPLAPGAPGPAAPLGPLTPAAPPASPGAPGGGLLGIPPALDVLGGPPSPTRPSNAGATIRATPSAPPVTREPAPPPDRTWMKRLITPAIVVVMLGVVIFAFIQLTSGHRDPIARRADGPAVNVRGLPSTTPRGPTTPQAPPNTPRIVQPPPEADYRPRAVLAVSAVDGEVLQCLGGRRRIVDSAGAVVRFDNANGRVFEITSLTFEGQGRNDTRALDQCIRTALNHARFTPDANATGYTVVSRGWQRIAGGRRGGSRGGNGGYVAFPFGNYSH